MTNKIKNSCSTIFLCVGMLAYGTAPATASENASEVIANQAGTVAGTAVACNVDTAEYKKRVGMLLDASGTTDVPASELKEVFSDAVAESRRQYHSTPTIGCVSFKRMFSSFLINQPDWKVSQGW